MGTTQGRILLRKSNRRGPNPYGATVRLEKLTDEDAVVRLSPIYLTLYEAAAHLKGQISIDDYREIFETIWTDRARAAGWSLKIEYSNINGNTACIFRFSRKAA